MPINTDTFAEDYAEALADTVREALTRDLAPPERIPDIEVITPRYDARGKLLPIYRVWMRDCYTLLVHAHTAGEAASLAIEDTRAMLERTGLDRRMSPREKRQALSVDAWKQVG